MPDTFTECAILANVFDNYEQFNMMEKNFCLPILSFGGKIIIMQWGTFNCSVYTGVSAWGTCQKILTGVKLSKTFFRGCLYGDESA